MKLTAIAVAVVSLTACANVTKEQAGTVIGGIVGGVVGKKVGGDTGAAIGVALGAYIGNRLGAHLDEEDRKKLAELEQQALKTGSGGKFVTNKSKALVTVEPSPAPPTLEKPREYVLSGSAKPQPLVLMDPITIRAYVDTPVYDDIDEKRAPKLIIKQGVPIRVSAKVDRQDWAVIGDERAGLGYVPRRYLEAGLVGEAKAQPDDAPKAVAKADGSTAGRKGQQQRQARNAPSSSPAVPKSIDQQQYEQEMAALHVAYRPRSDSFPATSGVAAGTKPAAAGNVTVAKVSSECKVVVRTVAPPGGQPFSESIRYCNEPPEGWRPQAVA